MQRHAETSQVRERDDGDGDDDEMRRFSKGYLPYGLSFNHAGNAWGIEQPQKAARPSSR